MEIFTWGYGNRNILSLFNLIYENDIVAVIDCRRSPFCGWSDQWNKQQLNDSILKEFKGYVAYIHEPGFGNYGNGPTWEPCDCAIACEAINHYSECYRHDNILLLCCEKDVNKCHRKQVAELFNEEVIHLC